MQGRLLPGGDYQQFLRRNRRHSEHGCHSRETLAARPERYEGPELRPEVLTAVFTLSVQQRAVIVLTYWEDLTPASIATLMDISEGSVKRHLARGRSRLKEALTTRD